MISHKHKCIFVHVAKTGGTSIEKCLIGKDWWDINRKTKHLSAQSAKYIYRNHWDDYFKFSFVRNPWSLMASWYKFRQVEKVYGMGFKTFLLDYNFNLPTSSGEKSWMPDTLVQADLLFEKGNPLVDFIGKFENLQEDFDEVCDKIRLQRQQLPHIYKGKHKHYTEYYDDETREIVAKKYAKDIKYFNYKFGE